MGFQLFVYDLKPLVANQMKRMVEAKREDNMDHIIFQLPQDRMYLLALIA